jgi:hypothetical protein
LGGADTNAAADVTPLFTCFGSANLGLPLNPRVALFYQTTPDPFGFTPNPLGFGYRDLGQCMTGDSASTQGNEFLIRTPPLPPCAQAICGVAPVPGPSPIP